MSSSQSGAATLPKGFRYDRNELYPRTPEPSAPGEEAGLPPPLRPRLRLKRRNVSSQINAPTQQFLASVAAADMPIPSVEEPDIVDEEMLNLPEVQIHVQDDDSMDVYRNLRPRTFSPPKTPSLDLGSSLHASRYPNWSIDSSWSSSDMDSSPGYESSRPSTAFSTQTSSSVFSQFSHASDDDCISPELDSGDFTKSEARNESYSPRSKPRKAPWTRPMSSHLWSTYMLYLQDPKVTPVRLGKSGIPPSGVCSLVAREAKRSWRGAKGPMTATRSGSSTPTAETSKPFIQWPHTPAATRAHLRELCKLNSTAKSGRTPYLSKNPTPFNIVAHRRWNRRSTPARSPFVQDMAMSLTLSTSEIMQPEGPLAQLSSSQPDIADFPATGDSDTGTSTSEDTAERTHARLGSPFVAHSYGPSSSSTIAEGINVRPQSHTIGAHKLLKSPPRLFRSRSRTHSGTQKRRSVKGIEDQPRKRPSLAAALWGTPPETSTAEDQSVVSSTNPAEGDDMFVPRTAVDSKDNFVSPATQPQGSSSLTAPILRSPRLGSPFSGSTSHSFPNRLSQPVNFNLTALGWRFATVQQNSESSSETASVRSLSSRLTYINQRLREFRSRESGSRRSQSPF